MEFFWEMLSLQETMFLLILTGVLIKKLKIIDAAGRDLRIDRTGQQAAPLHLPELGRQHFLADRADGLLQFSKTLCPRHQIPENEHLPLVTDQRQRGFHRTGRKFFCRGCHLQVPPVYRSLQIL